VWFAGPVPAAAFVGWAVALYVAVELGTASLVGRALTGLLVVGLVVVPVLAIGALGEGPAHAREFVAFGTNIVIFRAIAYARERWRGELVRVPIERALLSLFFFPTFVNGPVESPRAQLAGELAPATGADVRAGLLRIAAGVAKILAVGWALPPGWTSVLAAAPEAPAAALWVWAVGLYVWFYPLRGPARRTGSDAQRPRGRRELRSPVARTTRPSSGGAGTCRSGSGCGSTSTSRSAGTGAIAPSTSPPSSS
jgi:hypothetical protein